MKYSKYFFKELQNGSSKSAETVVPYLIDLLSPKSVVDVGCGTGTWLSAFIKARVVNILGIDGNYVDRSILKIPKKYFMTWDLTQPIKLRNRFDLAISLEVGEHLNKESSEILVNSLTRLSDVILFSAGIPLQGGMHHVNEQWPVYWKKVFLKNNYILIDCLRFKFWDNENVEPWYSQNMFIYVNKIQLGKYPRLSKETNNPVNIPLSIVHPKIYFKRAINKRDILRMLARLLKEKFLW